ncbi:MAG TPA: hypothetical protein VJ045_06865 [Hyphomicrobiaceae bacterium]|nr:hypothetical protein [Hyphomicrobiaceae bacterium]
MAVIRLPAAAILFASSGVLSVALAAPLEPAACDGLKRERDTLLTQGVKTDMERGPEWAKANLDPGRLKLVEHLIEVEEQLAFRCQRLRITTGKARGKKKGAATEPGAEGNAEPASSSAKTGSEPASSPAKTGSEPAAPRPAKKKRAASKSKASDAFVPPPANVGTAPEAAAQ